MNATLIEAQSAYTLAIEEARRLEEEGDQWGAEERWLEASHLEEIIREEGPHGPSSFA